MKNLFPTAIFCIFYAEYKIAIYIVRLYNVYGKLI